jgi:hypothetical protein
MLWGTTMSAGGVMVPYGTSGVMMALCLSLTTRVAVFPRPRHYGDQALSDRATAVASAAPGLDPIESLDLALLVESARLP